MISQVDKTQHNKVAAVIAGCPVERLPGDTPAKVRLFALLARDVLAKVAREPIAEAVGGFRGTNVARLVRTQGMALHDQVARVLHQTGTDALDELYGQRPEHGGCPVTGMTRTALTTGADAGVFAEATTLHTIEAGLRGGEARVSLAGLKASVRLPKAQARLSLDGLEQSWARLAVPLDGPGTCSGTDRRVRDGAYTLHHGRGLVVHDADTAPLTVDPQNPQLGCPALAVGLVQDMHTMAVQGAVRQGIIVPKNY